jgi:predicted dehydrogenase
MGSYWRRREWRDGAKPPGNTLTLQKAVHQLDLQMHFAGSQAAKVYASAGQTHFGGDKPAGLTCEKCDERDSCLYAADRMMINGTPNPRAAKDQLCVFGSDVNLHDHQVVSIDYKNGVRGSYVECFFTPDYRFEQTIIGDLGRIELRYRVGDDAMQLRTSYIGSTKVEEMQPTVHGSHGGGDFGLGAAFAEAVRTGVAIQPTAEDGFNAVALAEAIDLSAKSCEPAIVARPGIEKIAG